MLDKRAWPVGQKDMSCLSAIIFRAYRPRGKAIRDPEGGASCILFLEKEPLLKIKNVRHRVVFQILVRGFLLPEIIFGISG